jgi:hypothetical protein
MISFSFSDTKSCDGRHPAPQAYEDITVTIGPVSILTPSLVGQCVGALVNFENGPFRVRMDGGNPVNGTSGYLRSGGDEYFFSREEALRLVVIIDQAAGGVNGSLRVTYYG